MTLAIRAATAADLALTIELLENAGLPEADLSADRLMHVEQE